MRPDSGRVRVRIPLALVVTLIGGILTAPCLAAQPIDVVDPHVRATSAFTPRGDAAPLPLSSFSVSHGIGIVTDDGLQWRIAGASRELVTAWLATDGVVVCAGRMINIRNGDMVRAIRLE